MMELTDKNLMPFGRYVGTPMEDVPAGHFFWLWVDNGAEWDRKSLVARYIRRKLETLRMKYPDRVWPDGAWRR